MRVLDPGPAGGDALVKREYKKGAFGGVQEAAASAFYHSSYKASHGTPAGTLARQGMNVMSRSFSTPAVQAMPAMGMSPQKQQQMPKSPSLPRLVAEGSPASPSRPSSGSQSQMMPQSQPHMQMQLMSPKQGTAFQSDPFQLGNNAGSNAAQQRALAELLGNPDLKQMAKKMFNMYDTGNDGSLDMQELTKCIMALHQSLGVDQMEPRAIERLFKKYDVRHDERLDFEEFFDLLLAQLRREAFSRRDVINREFFITKNKGNVWDEFEKLKELGAGTFGTAYLAKSITGEDRVVKAVKKSRVKIPLEDVEREIMVMRQVDHPHIVRLFRWYEDKKCVYLILEALKGGTLKDVVMEFQKQRKGLKEDWIREVTRQTVSALAYCHSLRLIHKDIKDENIMLLRKEARYDKPYVVIIDLGIAEMFTLSDPQGHECGGTPVTMAPEVWANNFGPKCDVWSVGCVVFEMMAGTFPFMATSMNPQAWIRLHKRGPDWTQCKASSQGKKCCEALLTFDEAKRPLMIDVLQNEWFQIPLREMKTVAPGQFSGLQAFAKESSVKRALLLEIAARLPMDKAGEIVEIFENIDKNGDGRLSRQELMGFFQEVGITDPTMCDQIFKAMDVDGDGELSFTEFAAGVMHVFKDLCEDRLHKLMAQFDENRDGMTSQAEMTAMMQGVAKAIGGERSDEVMQGIMTSSFSPKADPKSAGYQYQDLGRKLLAPKTPSVRSSQRSSQRR